jgi:pilus assembly protein CpaC
MRRLTIAIFSLLALSVLVPTLALAQGGGRVQRRELELMVGEQSSVDAVGVQSYSEGAPGIVDVRVTSDGTQFVVVALAPGSTTLLLIYEDRQVQYRIRVRDESAEAEPTTGVQEVDNIRLDVYFLEFAENYGHQLGIGWPSSFGVGGIAGVNFNVTQNLSAGTGTSAISANASIANQPLPRLDLLQASGWARVMKQAALITANGNEATFNSTEEVNVVIAGGLSGALRTITVGSVIGVTPRYDRQTGRVELRVRTEASTLTSGRGTGVPGRLVSNVDTVVNLEMGQAIVLGGVLAERQQMEQSGLPGLSQIPILGILFGTNQTSREYSQNALFVIPTVVDVVSMQAKQRIADAFDVYWGYTGGLSDIVLVDMPPGNPSAAHPDTRDNAPRQRTPTPREE